MTLCFVIFSHDSGDPMGLGHLYEVPRTHSDRPHSVGLFWMSDVSLARTSTWQHTTHTTNRHPCPRRNSNLQPLELRGRRPTP